MITNLQMISNIFGYSKMSDEQVVNHVLEVLYRAHGDFFEIYRDFFTRTQSPSKSKQWKNLRVELERFWRKRVLETGKC